MKLFITIFLLAVNILFCVASDDARAPKELTLKRIDANTLEANIDSPMVVFDIYNMACPKCQAKAPKVNELHKMIEDAGLKDKIFMVGVASGNSELENSLFVAKYKMTFPTYPDPDDKFFKELSPRGIPAYAVATKIDDGKYRLIYIGDGFGENVKFLEFLVKRGGFKK